MTFCLMNTPFICLLPLLSEGKCLVNSCLTNDAKRVLFFVKILIELQLQDEIFCLIDEAIQLKDHHLH